MQSGEALCPRGKSSAAGGLTHGIGSAPAAPEHIREGSDGRGDFRAVSWTVINQLKRISVVTEAASNDVNRAGLVR